LTNLENRNEFLTLSLSCGSGNHFVRESGSESLTFMISDFASGAVAGLAVAMPIGAVGALLLSARESALLSPRLRLLASPRSTAGTR
jgi:hypothetical protein